MNFIEFHHSFYCYYVSIYNGLIRRNLCSDILYILLLTSVIYFCYFAFLQSPQLYCNTLIVLCLCCIVIGYIRSSINDGPGCLMLRCPDPSCGAAVGQDMIHMFACDDDKCKYSKYLLRSFVEDNKKVKMKVNYN